MTARSKPAAAQDGFFSAPLAETDPELAAAIGRELARQQDGIELIASENIVSRAVLEAQGSVLTNKYAEGYPGRRYYGGCDYVDVAEQLAIDRAKQLFDCALRQCAAAFRRAGQPGGVSRPAEAGRHHPRHEPRRRRPPDPRRGAQPVGQMVPRRPVRRAPRGRAARLRRARAPGPGGTAQADHRRRLGLSAHHRLRPLPPRSPTRWARYFMVDMAHFAGLVAAGVYPEPAAASPMSSPPPRTRPCAARAAA